MADEHFIVETMFGMFEKAKEVYGDELESFWFYENEVCPCCNRNNISTFTNDEQSYLSINSFIYNEMQVMIFYFLCWDCFNKLPALSGMKKEESYGSIEGTIIRAYHDYLSSIAS